MKKLLLLLPLLAGCQEDFEICKYNGRIIADKNPNYEFVFEKECSIESVEVPSFYFFKYQVGDTIGREPQLERLRRQIKDKESSYRSDLKRLSFTLTNISID